MKAKTINLHIEKLVIDGLRDLNRHHVGAAVQNELSRLLGSQHLPDSLTQSSSIKAIDAKPIGKVSSERRLGLQIADSVYRGMKG